ncbi:low temperature requirement protein A [Micromonospora sp. NPDC007208]|uniref:low temperature requirement protein A n=1 Tax=Micromonospora sp. NPDC007208 TaxID=3364236 RepID=UPI00367B5540
MRGDAGVAVPAQPDPARPATLELFFDLAYVFVLLALSEKLLSELTWVGAWQTLILLLAFSLLWALTAWAGDAVDLSEPLIGPQVVLVMAGSLLLASVVADAYGNSGLLFAIVYLTTNLTKGAYYLLIVPNPALKLRVRRILFWQAATAAPWILGGLVAGTTRGVLWAVAVAVEYAGVALGWPTPWSWSRLPSAARVVGERIAERYRQFVIVALSVSVFLTGRSFSLSGFTTGQAGALVVVFIITVMIWRIYIYRAGDELTSTIATSANPARLREVFAFVHLIMVAGILCTAVTSQLVITRPFGDTPTSWAAVILGGPGLFLIGRVMLDYTLFGRVDPVRLIGLLLLAGLAPTTPLLPPIMAALVVMVILIAVATANLVGDRIRPPTPAP